MIWDFYDTFCQPQAKLEMHAKAKLTTKRNFPPGLRTLLKKEQYENHQNHGHDNHHHNHHDIVFKPVEKRNCIRLVGNPVQTGERRDLMARFEKRSRQPNKTTKQQNQHKITTVHTLQKT